MTDAELAAIRERCEKATPGQWGPRQWDEFTLAWFRGNDPQGNSDADFIAHARQDIPALLAEVDRLRLEIERLKAGIELDAFGEGRWS